MKRPAFHLAFLLSILVLCGVAASESMREQDWRQVVAIAAKGKELLQRELAAKGKTRENLLMQRIAAYREAAELMGKFRDEWVKNRISTTWVRATYDFAFYLEMAHRPGTALYNYYRCMDHPMLSSATINGQPLGPIVNRRAHNIEADFRALDAQNREDRPTDEPGPRPGGRWGGRVVRERIILRPGGSHEDPPARSEAIPEAELPETALPSAAMREPGQSWDASADFSIRSNPNGAWTYGWFPRESSLDFRLYEASDNTGGDAGKKAWHPSGREKPSVVLRVGEVNPDRWSSGPFRLCGGRSEERRVGKEC